MAEDDDISQEEGAMTDDDDKSKESSGHEMKEQAKEFLEDLNDINDVAAAVGTQEMPDMTNKSDYAISAVSIGGPEPKIPSPPAKRRDLHKKLSESISTSRDTRLSDEDALKLVGSRFTRFNEGLTDLSDGIFRHGHNENHQHTTVAYFRVVMWLFFILGFTGAFMLLISWIGPTPEKMAIQLPFSESESTGCDKIIDSLDASEFVNSTALHDEDSPQHKAMLWICEEDAAKLNVDDPGLLTRYALAVLYYGTSGRSPAATSFEQTDWICNDSWLTEAGYCSWFGITCADEEDNLEIDVNGDILQIELSQNFLSGKIPGELSAISDAFGFHFDSNFLYGSIPTHFGLLTNLRELRLSDNKLKGTIPPELGSMMELRELTLAANELTGEIPETLDQATHMHYLALEDNHLKGTIPAGIFLSLTALDTFHASNNELTGSIPEELYDMTTLSTIRLSENELSGPLSAKLGKLINLGTFRNLLQLYTMNNSHFLVLESLHLTDNHLNGKIPDAFSELDLLIECKLGQNEFTGAVPASLGESLALAELAVEGNLLTGDVPEEICALTLIGSLEALTADCYTEMENGDVFDGLICECCSECFVADMA